MADLDDDLSASTARFRAFAEHTDENPSASWQRRAPGSRIGLLVAIVVVIVAIVAILLAH